MEPWRVREVYLFWTDQPDYWEDISCCFEGRVSALARHASQVGLEVDRLTDRIRESARKTGEKPGYNHAEAFKRLVL